jgi:endonuclease III
MSSCPRLHRTSPPTRLHRTSLLDRIRHWGYMDIDWDACLTKITQTLSQERGGLPSVSLIASRNNDPFHVLISTLISLRTKDSIE